MKKIPDIFCTIKAFSLIELMISLITISCITAAFAPVISKKLSSSNVILGGNNVSDITTECSDKFGASCTLCYSNKCIACSLSCSNGNYKNNDKCGCFSCNDFSSNCLLCNSSGCTKCSVGYGIKDKACEMCPSGKYQDEQGKSSCKIPPDGTYQDQTGQSTTKPCPEDNYCVNGIKTPCPTGKGANVGSSSCTNCSSEISNCAECFNLTQCTKCNAGFYLNSGSCIQCSAGSYCNGITQTKCPAGKYSSSAGATTCANCQAGKWSSAGSTTCTDCPAGYACNGAGTATKCSAGQYAIKGSSSCKNCPTGQYSFAGASSCSTCSSKIANCTACSASGSTVKCLACASGYKLNSTSTGCDVALVCGTRVTCKTRTSCPGNCRASTTGAPCACDAVISVKNSSGTACEVSSYESKWNWAATSSDYWCTPQDDWGNCTLLITLEKLEQNCINVCRQYYPNALEIKYVGHSYGINYP